jgi:plasmid stability protein
MTIPQNKDRKPTADDLAETRVRMGDALAALGRTIGLANEDFEIFDRVRYNTPEAF